jgi:hypothetical protein
MKIRSRTPDICDDGGRVLRYYFTLSDLSNVCKDGEGCWGGSLRFYGR